MKSELKGTSVPGSLTYNGSPGRVTSIEHEISHPGIDIFSNISENDIKFPVPPITYQKLRFGRSNSESAPVQSNGACVTKIGCIVVSLSLKDIQLIVKAYSYPGISFSVITIFEVRVFPSFVTLV